MPVRIHPSILAADFANLEAELNRIRSADQVHVDVMDNHFVPNLTFGLQMVRRLAEVSPRPLDVHLMIENPDRYAAEYATAGAASVTFHLEAATDAAATAAAIRAAGAKVGIALKPATPAEPILGILGAFDLLLVMTVEPGFGGQQFQEATMPKLRILADAVAASGRDTRLQVDGGITETTIQLAAAAGADTFVAGSSVFTAADPAERIARLRAAATRRRADPVRPPASLEE